VRFGGRPATGVTSVFASIFSVVGFQIVSLGLHAKTYSWSRRFDRDNRLLATFYRRFKLSPPSWSSGCARTSCRCRIPSGRHSAQRSSSWASAILGFSIIFSSLFISAMSMTRSEDYR
jgi:hypothetical protein